MSQNRLSTFLKKKKKQSKPLQIIIPRAILHKIACPKIGFRHFLKNAEQIEVKLKKLTF